MMAGQPLKVGLFSSFRRVKAPSIGTVPPCDLVWPSLHVGSLIWLLRKLEIAEKVANRSQLGGRTNLCSNSQPPSGTPGVLCLSGLECTEKIGPRYLCLRLHLRHGRVPFFAAIPLAMPCTSCSRPKTRWHQSATPGEAD